MQTEPFTSRNLPLNEIHQAAGASFMELFGWRVVRSFSSLESEYWAIRKSAGLIDLSWSGIFELKGDDRTRFLQGMVTNDIKSLTPGSGCYAAFLSPQGRLTSDMRIFCSADSLVLTTEPAGREKLGPGLRKYIIGDRPQLLDRSAELGLLSLQGPKANELLAELLSQPISTQPYGHFETKLGDARIRVCHVRRTGVEGWDLIIDMENLPKVWNLILERGQKHGLQPIGFDGFDVHRIEAGIPWYGLDMDENTLPIEAGLEKVAISFSKGCYIGQESVARITYRGHVNRKLSGLLGDNGRVATKGDKVFRGEQEVGWITSSSYSPLLEKAISLGYLRREVLEAGTPLRIEHAGESLGTFVSALPFS